MLDNFEPVQKLNPNELPEGFSIQDPAKSSSAAAANDEQQQLRKEAILAQALTSNALERLRRIKLVRSVESVERTILQMAPRLTERISEDKLIELLERGNRKQPPKSTIMIQRKKYNIDSDDDDDNDDDLL